MCCFSRPVKHVSGTRIFARAASGDRQVLAYSMTVGAEEDLAMVLPLPVPPNSPEDAVRFIDLSGYPTFFADLAEAFPPTFAPQVRGGLTLKAARAAPKLVVHDVGDFEASFVPRIEDFERLDERFRLSPDVWARLPAYADHGFAVFKLKGFLPGLLGRIFGGRAGGRTKTIHPMAFEFPRRDPGSLFFPTVHVHDGEVHAMAWFDHTLYWQVSARDAHADPSPFRDAVASATAVARAVDVKRTQGLVDPALPCERRTLLGTRTNEDILVSA